MISELSPTDKAKYAAAKRSVDFIETGMRVGLGTGSTAAWMVKCLGERIQQEGLRIEAVPTSVQTAELAKSVGISVISLEEARWLDVTIDGADECDSDLNLIKGGGGALLHEKVVATASDKMVVIADAAKEVGNLGAFPLPVEIIPFGWQTTKALIEEALLNMDVIGHQARLRQKQDKVFRTDEGNVILDLELKKIGDPRQLSLVLNQIPGVVENGLFIDICDIAIIGHEDGKVEMRELPLSAVVKERPKQLDGPDNLFSDLAD